ncbi:MAG: Gfo/Idh/MocA family oxidoreductase [Phycisphaerales bacterium]|nr:Gfo/Idh/MocA family oxidoreductase [Phycisphaerales bacterium]
MSIRLGIVGMGRIGRQQLACASQIEGLEIAAVVEPAGSDLSGVLDGSIRRYSRWEELVADASLDAVSICTPHHLHAAIATAALNAGKHVLVEKPLAMTGDEARAVVELAKERERVLMVELTHRFYPPVMEAREMVTGGRVGTIYAVEDRIVEPAGEQIRSWLTEKSLAGGGVALTNGIHMVDRVAAVTGRKLGFISGVAGYAGGLGDVEETAAMLLTAGDGIPVQLLAAWPRGVGGCDDELTIYGSKGTLRVWAWRGWRFEPLAAGELAEQHDSYAPADDSIEARVRVGVSGALREFVGAIEGHREPVPSAADVLAAQELIEQFYRHVRRVDG